MRRRSYHVIAGAASRPRFSSEPKLARLGPIFLTIGSRKGERTGRTKWASSSLIELECTEYDRPYRWTWVNGGPIAVTLHVPTR